MNNPLISVIVPVYNAEKYIEEAIKNKAEKEKAEEKNTNQDTSLQQSNDDCDIKVEEIEYTIKEVTDFFMNLFYEFMDSILDNRSIMNFLEFKSFEK